MQFAVRTNDAMTGNDQGHWIGCIGASHRAWCIRTTDLRRDLGIGAGFAVGNGEDGPECLPLKIGCEQLPVDPYFEGPSITIRAGILSTVEISGDTFLRLPS